MTARYAVWLSRDDGARALACATSRYQRDLVIGVEPWFRVGRATAVATSNELSRRGLRQRMRERGVVATVSPLPAALTRIATAGLATADVLIVGEVARGFVDAPDHRGRILAASLVLATVEGRRDGACPGELRDLLDGMRDHEQLFGAFDGVRDRDNVPIDEPDDRCLYCGQAMAPLTAPATNDDGEWSIVARMHRPGCEWARTRAFARPDTYVTID